MARKLAATVHGLRNEETGEVASFAAGDTLPKWAEGMVTNPAAFAEDDTTPKAPSKPDR